MDRNEITEKGLEASKLRASLEIDKTARSIAEALWEIAFQLRILNDGNGTDQ